MLLLSAGFAASPAPQPTKPAKPDRADERNRIKAALFVPNRLPALESESYGQFEPAPGVVAERVSYATGYSLRVPAIV